MLAILLPNMMAPAVDPASAQPPLLSSAHDPSREGFKRRLERIADHVGSVNALAKASRIPQSTIRKYFERGEAPSRTIIALAQAASVRPEWLLTGCEPMWYVPPPNDGEKSAIDDVVFVPLFRRTRAGASLLAGRENLVDADDYLPFKRSWLRHYLRSDCDNLALAYAEGDSMEPLLRQGDMVLINRDEVEIKDGIYTVLRGKELLIKRLQIGGSGEIKIISENKAYEPVEVRAADFDDLMRIIGRVTLAVRRLP